MTEHASKGTPTVEIFTDRFNKFKEESLETHKDFVAELAVWGTSLPGHGTLGDAVAEQIDYHVKINTANDNPITTEDFVEGLFLPNREGNLSADIIMNRLLTG